MDDFLSYLIEKGYFSRLFPRPDNGFSGGVAYLVPHATTVVGLVFNEGVLLCADSQATDTGRLDRLREPVQKLFSIGDCAVLGIAGAPGIAQRVARVLDAAVSAETCLSGSIPSTEKYGLMLQTISAQLLPMVMQSGGQLAVAFISGIYDAEDKRGHLFTADPSGFLCEYRETGYAAEGSGGEHAQSYLDHIDYRADTATKTTALRAGIIALRHAVKRNAATGSPFHAVAVQGDGVAVISPQEITQAQVPEAELDGGE